MRRMVAAAVAVLLLPGLVACGEDDAPKASPAPSASSSATAASAPTLPAEARGSGPKAAEAFVRHYVDLINHATSTLDTRPLRQASAAACGGCSSIGDLYDDVRTNGGRVQGGTWSIEKLEVRGPEGRAYVRVSYPRQVVQYASDEEAKSFPPGEALFVFEYRRTAGRFMVTRVQGPVQ